MRHRFLTHTERNIYQLLKLSFLCFRELIYSNSRSDIGRRMLELNLDFGSTDSALEKLKNSKNRLSRDQIRQKNAQKESRSEF